ncbi:MAG: APC family permease, partial [Candidatus Aenigmatarchaeota archaeon]
VITTALYVMVALSSVALVDWNVLGQSSSPLSLVAQTGWGPLGFTVISAIALFSTTNTVLIILISTSRILYGASKKEYGSFPGVLSRIHPKRKTPHFSILLVLVLSALFVLLGDIGVVASLTNLFLLVVFILVNLSVIKTRYRDIDRKGSFRAPINIGRFPLTALAGVLTCLGLVVFYIVQLL